MSKILVIGAGGQIGTELVIALRNSKGSSNVIAADIKDEPTEAIANGPYVQIDVLDRLKVRGYIIDNQINRIYSNTIMC